MFILVSLLSVKPTSAQITDLPFREFATHDINNIFLRVNNDGLVGIYYDPGFAYTIVFSGEISFRFPKGAPRLYPTPGIDVGGIVGGDTLVSLGREFYAGTQEAQDESGERITISTSLDSEANLNPEQVSQQDIRCVYYDTLTGSEYMFEDRLDNRPHIPLPIRVVQSSYAWSYEHVKNIIFFNYEITNIGRKDINRLFLGIHFGGGAGDATEVEPPGEGRDICGFYQYVKLPEIASPNCDIPSELNLMWVSDNDGDPDPGEIVFDEQSTLGAMGVVLLSERFGGQTVGFNWWHRSLDAERDFGPRKAGGPNNPVRLFGNSLGSPGGDREYYHIMSSGEQDYDQYLTALDHTSFGWLPPPPNAAEIAVGSGEYGSNRMLSVGPSTLAPGQTIRFSYAYVGTEELHTNPRNFVDNWDPLQPQKYIDGLDFNDLLTTANWAKWVYDNPGFDTDKDGYLGEFQICAYDSALTRILTVVDSSTVPPSTTLVLDTFSLETIIDTIWITGDGIPDFRAAVPPPAPVARFEPSDGKLDILWNGLEPENTPDIFTGEIDFEGYRVYIGLVKRSGDMSIVSSYDIENYTQFWLNPVKRLFQKEFFWEVLRKPFSLKEAQIAYGGGRTDFDPLSATIDKPLQVGDSAFYFVKQDWNQSDLTDTLAIHRIYPNEPYPHTLDLSKAYTEDTWHTDSLTGEMTFYQGGELTADGKYFKYFEYRFKLENLLPSQRYFVSVTAFDFGSPGSGLPALETNPVKSAVEALAQNKVFASAVEALDVIVYPNPYRIDGAYRSQGFEGRGSEDRPNDRVREIHFTNLPPVCDVSVYSLDGDLVRVIEHRTAPSDPNSMHDSWDVISRNLLPIASGIYYWVVETPEGRTQVGKLVIIM